MAKTNVYTTPYPSNHGCVTSDARFFEALKIHRDRCRKQNKDMLLYSVYDATF